MLREALFLIPFFISVNGHREPTPDKNAVVTLVTGVNSGYTAGAIALGQSLKDVKSKLHRIVMVTPEVDQQSRKQMSKVWEVIEVQPIYCNHKMHPSITPDKFDLSGANYQAGIKRWQSTCTKFQAWSLTKYERILFMDSDTLVVNPIDDVLYGFSNASFLASPEAFPPDNFNSGFMVLNPSKKNFDQLLELNERVGSAEGGDQGVFNNGLCPNWFFANSDDPNCGRLPWLFNVEAANFAEYNTLRQMSGLRLPSVIHFVSDGKPWKVLSMDYTGQFADETKHMLMKQAITHLLWRQAYFRCTGEQQPRISVFDELTNPEAYAARMKATATATAAATAAASSSTKKRTSEEESKDVSKKDKKKKRRLGKKKGNKKQRRNEL
eukprot:gene8312-17110_t